MKLTAIILLSACLTASAEGYSQKVTLSVKNALLENVLNEIKKQTGYSIFSNYNLLENAKRVTITIKDATVEEALKACLKGYPLDYEIAGKSIVITAKKTAEVELPKLPPPIDINGRVLDEKGQPLSGATINERGKANSTTSKNDGSFSIKVSDSKAVLTISFIGYKTMDVEVGNQSSILVHLVTSTASLSDVVVIGYGSVRKKDLTGSVASINSKDFNSGTIISPDQLVSGKIAGVVITSGNGVPGAGSRINIRGLASINANQAPLIVVDGIPLESSGVSGSVNSLALINPNDIETFTFLKDASAAAIYGSRASNGVILITTKKGSSNARLDITYTTNNSVAVKTKTVESLSIDQFKDIVNSKGSDYQKSVLGSMRTNWNSEIFDPALATDNNLIFSGGIKGLPYRLSLGYLNQNGTLNTGYYKRYTAALNLNPSFFSDHLNVNVNLRHGTEKNRFADQSAISTAIYYDPTQPVYLATSPYGGYFEYIDTATGYVNFKNPINPLDYLQSKNTSQADKFIGNLVLDYRFHFITGLRANINLGIENSNGKGNNFTPLTQASAAVQGGYQSRYNQKRRNKTAEFYFKYEKALKVVESNIDFTVGYGYYDFWHATPKIIGKNLSGDTISVSAPDSSQNTLISYYARLQYKFKERFFLTGTIRTDGSSKFSPQTRWGTFPSAAIAYEVVKENANLLSHLKVRVGYGVTGQREIPSDYGYIPTYTFSTPFVRYGFGNEYVNTVTPGGYNTDLKWETTKSSNVGIDFGFFNNKLNGSFDVYLKKTSNLLLLADLPAGANLVSQIYQNIGTLENRGFEFSLNASPITTKRFQWNLNFNASYNQNEVTKLTVYQDPDFQGYNTGYVGETYVQKIQVGYPAYTFFAYRQLYDNAGKPIEGQYEDINKDGKINDDDRYFGKSSFPKYLFGFSSNFQYNRFNWGFVARASFGNHLYTANAVQGNYTWMLGTFLVPVNAPASILKTQFTAPQELSDYYIQSASFLKIDNIYAGYDFGKIYRDRINLTVSAIVQNAFVFTKYTGIDPEIAGGIDASFYPRSRVYNLAVKLQF